MPHLDAKTILCKECGRRGQYTRQKDYLVDLLTESRVYRCVCGQEITVI